MVRLGRKSVSKGLVRVLSAARARMASSNAALKEEVDRLRRAVKEQVKGLVIRASLFFHVVCQAREPTGPELGTPM